MKDLLRGLADLECRIFDVRATLGKLQNDVRSVMGRIELQEAQMLDADLTPSQMFEKIHELTSELPLNMTNTPGRVTASLGQITTHGKSADDAIINLYKILKYRGVL